jgi:hypothetical protein
MKEISNKRKLLLLALGIFCVLVIPYLINEAYKLGDAEQISSFSIS